MDDDDQSAAEQYQMELEQRQQEEEALNKCRRLTAQLRADNRQFDIDMQHLNERINYLLEHAND